MDVRKLAKLRRELTAFLNEVAGTLGNARRRRWCDAYVRGLLLDGHRKSAEPMAARLKTIEQGDGDYEQALQQFLNQSPWDDGAVRDGLQAWVARQFGTDGVVIIDDTGFPKQGTRSVGVARQYTGPLGKVASCQVAVTLQSATGEEVVGLDARLYLPRAWADGADRMARAGVPAAVTYEPKWQMALAMLRRAAAHGFRGVVPADSLFGSVTEFRERLAADGRAYCVGIDSTLKVIAADADLGPAPPRPRTGRPPTRPAKVRRGATSPSVRQGVVDRATDFRSVAWREGTKGRMTGRFAARRVRPAHQLSAGKVPLAPCWLLAEWPAGADQPAKSFFSNLPAGTTLKRLVATAKSRWWVEHSYRARKDELGLDHFEGRSRRGWNHHAVLVLLAYAFLQDVRRRRPQKVATGGPSRGGGRSSRRCWPAGALVARSAAKPSRSC
jgi:SRSO17 transposase